MNKYENEQIGKIVIIRNIIFSDSVTQNKEIDHAWKVGRPCIIICNDDEYDYILPLKTNMKKEQYEYHHFLLDDSKFLHRQIRINGCNNNKEKNRRKTKGAINLEKIYKIPISWHDETGKITFTAYKELINKLKIYHKKDDLNKILENAQIVRGR